MKTILQTLLAIQLFAGTAQAARGTLQETEKTRSQSPIAQAKAAALVDLETGEILCTASLDSLKSKAEDSVGIDQRCDLQKIQTMQAILNNSHTQAESQTAFLQFALPAYYSICTAAQLMVDDVLSNSAPKTKAAKIFRKVGRSLNAKVYDLPQAASDALFAGSLLAAVSVCIPVEIANVGLVLIADQILE